MLECNYIKCYNEAREKGVSIMMFGEKLQLLRKQKVVFAVAVTVISIAFIISFVQNIHMKRELRRLDERIANMERNLAFGTAGEEEKSLLTSFEVSEISERKEDMHSGTATYLCSIVPKEFKPGETSVVLIYEGKEYPAAFENGKFVVTLTVPFYESTSITEIQLRENGTVRTEQVSRSFEEYMQLPVVTTEFQGKVSDEMKKDEALRKYKGEFQICAAGLSWSFDSVSMIFCIDGEERNRTDVPQKNIAQMQWNREQDISNAELFYHSINEVFEIPFGSTFDLYMEMVDEYGLRYRVRAAHAKIDENGKAEENDILWRGVEACIYNRDGKLMYHAE